uniref:undecaprenyl-diphosphate phosphatase n=1 Tax=Lachnospira sp. TaxID=2049031 RepID=UPI003FF07AFE
MLIEILKAVLFGIVEGITEWLPISSTGHMILVDQFVHLNVSVDFYKMFEVVIQLGAIMAVVVLFWNKLWPFHMKNEKPAWKDGALSMWLKIIVAVIPAAIIGVLFDDKIDELFYHPVPVAIALIVVGVLFIVVETIMKGKKPSIRNIGQITYKAAVIIGLFQVLAAVFPGTSRSGATIIGALLIGVSRATAAEFTFFLAVPVMFGASLLKVIKYIAAGVAMTGSELVILVIGTLVAFIVSVFVIKFLMSYIKKHDFKVFGWYRIVLGILVLLILR